MSSLNTAIAKAKRILSERQLRIENAKHTNQIVIVTAEEGYNKELSGELVIVLAPEAPQEAF